MIIIFLYKNILTDIAINYKIKDKIRLYKQKVIIYCFLKLEEFGVWILFFAKLFPKKFNQ